MIWSSNFEQIIKFEEEPMHEVTATVIIFVSVFFAPLHYHSQREYIVVAFYLHSKFEFRTKFFLSLSPLRAFTFPILFISWFSSTDHVRTYNQIEVVMHDKSVKNIPQLPDYGF